MHKEPMHKDGLIPSCTMKLKEVKEMILGCYIATRFT